MLLPEARTAGYLTALSQGCRALAPSSDWVDVDGVIDLLEALDPALSGALLSPAELDGESGLPAWAWVERARAEQAVARSPASVADHSDAELALARRHDPALASRLEHRTRLHRSLRRAELAPVHQLSVVPRRRGRTEDFTLRLDAYISSLGWMRLKLDVSGIAGWHDPSVLTVDGDRATPGDGLRHLLARHKLTSLDALRLQLREVLGVQVPRLSRSWLGPFWFPGLPMLERQPPVFAGALTLHATLEVLAGDIQHTRDRDPLASYALPPPKGFGRWRERRLATTQPDAVRAWWAEQGDPGVVVPLSGR